MTGYMPPRLYLVPADADQMDRLIRFRQDHPEPGEPDEPGVIIAGPDAPHEPWQAHIGAGTVPGDGRVMAIYRMRLRDLLDELDDLFDPPEAEQDTG